MIRIACIAATLATGALLPVQSASATVNLNARIELLAHILHNDADFSGRDFSFSLRNGDSRDMVFKGIAGVRGFSDYATLNSWLQRNADAKGVFQGGSYKFTHSVLDGYFGSAAPASAATDAAPGVFDGGPYKFTHSVLGSYFDQPADAKITAQSTLVEPMAGPAVQPMMALAPIPEPATWAMMIGGFALVGAAMRRRSAAVRFA